MATQFEMGKQGFEMAAQVCAADDCLWTKFLLDLSKFWFSTNCGNIEIGDNWDDEVWTLKARDWDWLKQTYEHMIFKDQKKETWNGHIREAYILQKEDFADFVIQP